MASVMQGTNYAFPTRALPQLTREDDAHIKLTTQQAAWFGN
jgi:hypothetical protein